jgi:serine protease Do
MGLAVEHGILVQQVQPDTPAARAGLKRGDVIVRFNGEQVMDDSKFRLMVAATPVGKTVPVTVVREGTERRLDVTVAERPDEDVVASAPTRESSAWLGIRVEDASNSETRRQFGLERGQTGVVVTEVEEDSPAEEAGLRQGDVITEVYSHEVNGIEEYVAMSKKLQDRKEPIAFLVKRGRITTYVPVIPDRK